MASRTTGLAALFPAATALVLAQAVPAAAHDSGAKTDAKLRTLKRQRDKDVEVSFTNGRPTLTSSDGDFSIALRSLVQLDLAYYAQGKRPPGIDFSSGSNFRRARLGVNGTLFKDWSYEFIYDFGGSGGASGSISSAYLQYDGFGAVRLKLGAYAPPAGFDDSISSSDLLFLERAQPADVARSIGAADGRYAATIFANDERAFAALSATGGVAGQSAAFDQQQAVVGRLAYRAVKTADANLAVGVNGTYVFKLAGPNAPSLFRLRARPELNVDNQNIRLIDTGAIDASSVWQWGVEAAGNWQSLYGQGGYFGYTVNRRASLLPDPSFAGWYVQASWLLTGEVKPYKADKAAYGLPTPSAPFDPARGTFGAWEIAARYSVLDLNDHAGLAVPFGGVRGGRQSIWSAGLNWYPNAAIRFQVNYQHTNVSRLSAVGGELGAVLDAVSLRAQLSL